jgi:type I restriction enzyme S subunit
MPIEKQALPELALEKWDILFNEGGDRDKLGRGWIWEGQIEPCITQNHVFRSSPYFASEYHSKFISHWGNTFGKNYFEKGGKQTTNLASINKSVLSMFPIPLPSMEEQEVVIKTLDDSMSLIESLESEVESSLAKSETLRQSILKKAFSGELVPQDPNDEPASALLARIQTDKDSRLAKPKTPADSTIK